MRKVDCPAGGWIGLPDEWLGLHAQRHAEARLQAETNNLVGAVADFAVAIALLDDWGELPGLDGNPAAWDYSQKSWPVMVWVSSTVFADLNEALRVPKVSPGALPGGGEHETMNSPSNGDLPS